MSLKVETMTADDIQKTYLMWRLARAKSQSKVLRSATISGDLMAISGFTSWCYRNKIRKDKLENIKKILSKKMRRQRTSRVGLNKEHYNRQSEDTFVLDRPELANVRAFIEAKLHEYVTKIFASTDKLVITQSWLNKSKKGESHHEHVHPNSMVSGVWYPAIHEQLPPIQFRSRGQRDVALQTTKYNTFNSATFMLPMKAGEMIIFPSNLSHSVPANQSDEERISLAFNTWPKGNMGDERSLTYLPLDRCV